MPYPRYLARAQRILNDVTLNTTAQVMRRTQVADSTGGFVDTYAEAFTVRCSFYRLGITPREAENTTTVQTVSFWQFDFPAGTDIRGSDRIVSDSRTFEVTSYGSGSVELVKRVLCTEIL